MELTTNQTPKGDIIIENRINNQPNPEGVKLLFKMEKTTNPTPKG
jgi:hypothetical protein